MHHIQFELNETAFTRLRHLFSIQTSQPLLGRNKNYATTVKQIIFSAFLWAPFRLLIRIVLRHPAGRIFLFSIMAAAFVDNIISAFQGKDKSNILNE